MTGATLVAVAVLFTRRNNEQIGTPMDPVCAYSASEHAALLTETGSFCYSSDDFRLVEGDLYSVSDVRLPAWLTVDEWVASAVDWKYTWGAGVDPTWPEAWQRGLKTLNPAQTSAASRLLVTLVADRFRSDFRRSVANQIVTWLETPEKGRRYDSPLSRRQWECVTNRDDHTVDRRLYSRRGVVVPAIAA